MTVPIWLWVDLHRSRNWPWLHNVSTSDSLAKGEDYPLKYTNLNDYESIFGHFLEATAFGMVPNSVWNGTYSVDGGIIVVTEAGKILCFYLQDRASNAACKDFLIENSFFDTASTSRHQFGSLINGNLFKLNLLIRI